MSLVQETRDRANGVSRTDIRNEKELQNVAWEFLNKLFRPVPWPIGLAVAFAGLLRDYFRSLMNPPNLDDFKASWFFNVFTYLLLVWRSCIVTQRWQAITLMALGWLLVFVSVQLFWTAGDRAPKVFYVWRIVNFSGFGQELRPYLIELRRNEMF